MINVNLCEEAPTLYFTLPISFAWNEAIPTLDLMTDQTKPERLSGIDILTETIVSSN